MKSRLLFSLILVLAVAACQPTTPVPEPTEPPESCIDFSDLTVGKEYTVGDSFVTSGVTVSVEPFIWSDGTPTSDGVAQVVADGLAGGSGNEVWTNNVNLRFDFGGPIDGLSLRFGEYGGNLNIEINGDFVNFEDMTDIDGAVIGGVTVSVPSGGFGGDMGVLVLTGTINSFSIGGQEFVIDDVCTGELAAASPSLCIDFSDLPVGMEFKFGDTFTTSSVTVSVEPFIFDDGTTSESDASAEATVETGGFAGSAGNEMMLNHVNLRFDFSAPVNGLSLRFGEFGDGDLQLNIEINGDFVNFERMFDIHDEVIGGVKVSVPSGGFGNDMGVLVLTGKISSFSIGGQRLWIDDLCTGELATNIPVPLLPSGRCVDFDDLNVGDEFPIPQPFVSSGVELSVEQYFDPAPVDQTIGSARVTAPGFAGGSGNEMFLSLVNLRFHFGGPVKEIALRFNVGAVGPGTVNIEVNKDRKLPASMIDINSAPISGVIGGVLVSVNMINPTAGVVRLNGTIDSFSIGGVELAIDDVCFIQIDL